MFNKVFRRARLIVMGSLAFVLFKLIHRKGFDKQDTIVICGSMRSGSTWLAELLSTLEGHLQVFEPLHTEYVKEADRIVKERIMYVPAQKDWQEGEAFFDRVLTGRLMTPWMASQMPIKRIFNANRLVVKFVRANLMLPWLCRQKGIRKPVLVLRHPCAIVTSQLKKEWPPGKYEVLNHSYMKANPELRAKCEQFDKPEELAAMGWCLRYHGVLKSESPQDFVVVSYEALVRNGKEELARIYDAWGQPLSQEVVDALERPSDTSTSTSFIVQGKDPLAAWQHYLTDEQVNNVMKVIEVFELDFYSRELEPDYKKLAEFGV